MCYGCLVGGISSIEVILGWILEDERAKRRCKEWTYVSLVLNHEVHQEKEKKEGATLPKHIEYPKIKATYEFSVLVAIGTLGPINNDGIVFFTDMENRPICAEPVTKENQNSEIRDCVCIQRTNACFPWPFWGLWIGSTRRTPRTMRDYVS